MNPKYKKIYCCMPVSFIAGEWFHDRDSGLIAKTLRGMGVDSQCILALPWHEESSHHDIIRTEYENLKSVAWWKNLGIDALVLYSWGAPRYLPIARAIHKAGIKLIIHLDMGPNLHGAKNGTLRAFFNDIRINLMRRWHIGYADVITGSEKLIHELSNSAFYGKKIANKCINFPSPVAPRFTTSTQAKQYKVTCVGRWSDEDLVKRPDFCIRTAQELVKIDPNVIVEIYGRTGKTIEQIYNDTTIGKERIFLKGFAPNDSLPQIYQSSMVNYCSSRSEGTHIASCEALCCGCSIVTPPRKQLSTLHWYTEKNSGRIATEDTPEAMAQAIADELNAWTKGERSATEIANAWQPCFHVDKIINNIFR